MDICVNYMHECKVVECILGVYFECISILPPLFLWANIRQPMKSHLVKTPEHLLPAELFIVMCKDLPISLDKTRNISQREA